MIYLLSIYHIYKSFKIGQRTEIGTSNIIWLEKIAYLLYNKLQCYQINDTFHSVFVSDHKIKWYDLNCYCIAYFFNILIFQFYRVALSHVLF